MPPILVGSCLPCYRSCADARVSAQPMLNERVYGEVGEPIEDVRSVGTIRRLALACKVVKAEPEKAAIAAVALEANGGEGGPDGRSNRHGTAVRVRAPRSERSRLGSSMLHG